MGQPINQDTEGRPCLSNVHRPQALQGEDQAALNSAQSCAVFCYGCEHFSRIPAECFAR